MHCSALHCRSPSRIAPHCTLLHTTVLGSLHVPYCAALHPSAQYLAHCTCSVLPRTALCLRVAALAQERVHSEDQKQYWMNLVLLLFAGADMCDRVLAEKV